MTAQRPAENQALDLVKFAACLLVAASHCLPLFETESYNLYFGQWLFRFCVPLFFLSTGYYFQKTERKAQAIRRIMLLYGLSLILYAPNILERILKAPTTRAAVMATLQSVVFGYFHLWFLSATVLGLLLWYGIEKHAAANRVFQTCKVVLLPALLLAGALLDEYHGLISWQPLETLRRVCAQLGGARHFLLFGFPMLVLGGEIASQERRLHRVRTGILVAGLAAAWCLSFLECRFLFSRLGTGITNDVTVCNYWPAIFLFLLTFRIPLQLPAGWGRSLRKLSEYIYVVHPLVMSNISLHLGWHGKRRWIAAVAICVASGLLLQMLVQKKRG